MSYATKGHVIGQDCSDTRQTTKVRGIAAGTVILTLDGALPVEFLNPGDRIITREGMRVVREVRVSRYSGAAIRVSAGALGHDRPEQDLVLPEETPILIRDWRAEALFGTAQALVPIARIADGEFIAPASVLSMRLYDLRFDTPQVVYAEGLELACEAVEVADAKIAAE
ncbi:Hint domain-containing protein [Defluviimonas sp. SAOS-178_SWC]|uniref:Hint domain-containing protein n=1 Tax=Defluviimonas sp. SAOS-178_SWC TaxID=3121287 RepID=UPI003221A5F2